MGAAHLVRSNPAVHRFTGKHPWSHHLFYVHGLYKDGTVGARAKEVESIK